MAVSRKHVILRNDVENGAGATELVKALLLTTIGGRSRLALTTTGMLFGRIQQATVAWLWGDAPLQPATVEEHVLAPAVMYYDATSW